MASKIIAQLVVMTTQIVGRAFVEAYRQAAANGGKNAAAASGAKAAANGTSSAVNEFTRKSGLSFEEAAKILNIERDTPREIIESRYKHLFDINDKKSGGSLYLQSKVFRAKERIDMELKPPAEEAKKITTSASEANKAEPK